MKQKFYNLFLWVGIIMSVSFSHPIKLTASLIDYNDEKHTIRMECRVFIDDFKKSINNNSVLRNVAILNPTEEDKIRIEEYFKKYYIISFNGKKIPFKFKNFEVKKAYNVITFKFLESSLKLKKGDQLFIENTMLFKDFGYSQSNMITMRFPPFFNERSHETSMTNISYSYTF